jgi:hypothetical protein
MTTERFRGRQITITEHADGHEWTYDDGTLVTYGMGGYGSEREAMDAAKAEIRAEGPLTGKGTTE